VELGRIGALLGHGQDSRMTARYAHLTPDQKHAAVEKLSGVVPQLVDGTKNAKGWPTEICAEIRRDTTQESASNY